MKHLYVKNPENLEVPEARISLTGNMTGSKIRPRYRFGVFFTNDIFCDDTLDPNNFL